MIFNFFGFVLLIFRVLGTSCLFFIPFLLDTSQMSNKRGRRPWVFPAMPSPPRQSQGQGEAWRRSAAEPAHPRGESGHRQPRGEGEVDLWGFVSVLSIAGAVSAGGGGMEGWMLRCIVAEEAFWGGGGGKRWCPGVLGSPPRCPQWRRTRYPAAASPTSSPTPCVGRSRRGQPRPVPRSEPPPSRDLQLNSAQKVALSLFSFLSGFQAASKFLRSQILPGAARKPGQQQVRAVSVPTTQPVLLLFHG